MDYIIKYGELKGKKVSEAFAEGKIKELLELKKYLLNNYDNINVRNKIIDGVSAIDFHMLNEYSKKLDTFYNRYNALSDIQKKQIKFSKEVFENCDLIGLNHILEQIETVSK